MLDTPSEILTGALHPYVSPLHALAILALGFGLSTLKRQPVWLMLGALVIGLYAGGLITMLAGMPPAIVLAAGATTVGLGLALMVEHPAPALLIGLAALAGLTHGAANLLELPADADLTGFVTGMMAGMALGTALIGWGLTRLPGRPGLIVRRIGASWVMAITLLITAADWFSR